jgi:CobQ-like glutamine amidotransferase family enzyme
MAADNHTTIVGNLVDDPELRFTNTGIAVTNLRVAVTQRVQQDGQWRDGETSFFKVNVWRGQAENLADSLGKGDRGMVTGRLRQRSWETPEGEKLPGVGIFDLHTEPRKPDEERLIGNVLVRVRAPQTDEVREVVGFENHGGRTYLGEGVQPLGEVVVGYGNNGKDGTEGARRLNAYGTYLHGSLLPKNPWLTDQLILNALRRVDENVELEPLDDAAERRAVESISNRIAGSRGARG